MEVDAYFEDLRQMVSGLEKDLNAELGRLSGKGRYSVMKGKMGTKTV